jgi:hypothetical protein
MAANRKTNDPYEPKSPWPGRVQFVFTIVLVMLLFLLARSMVQHNFFGGARYNNEPNTSSPSKW